MNETSSRALGGKKSYAFLLDDFYDGEWDYAKVKENESEVRKEKACLLASKIANFILSIKTANNCDIDSVLVIGSADSKRNLLRRYWSEAEDMYVGRNEVMPKSKTDPITDSDLALLRGFWFETLIYNELDGSVPFVKFQASPVDHKDEERKFEPEYRSVRVIINYKGKLR